MTKKKSDSTGTDIRRRRFIKKAAYSAPALISMGMLSGPLAAAREERSRPDDTCPDPPNCTFPSGPNTFHEETELNLETEKKEWV
jgi:hypothetical protein